MHVSPVDHGGAMLRGAYLFFFFIQGRSMADLSSEEILDLGQLVCELSPAQLQLFSPEALDSSLHAMAACSHIPRRHHLAILHLLKQTYG